MTPPSTEPYPGRRGRLARSVPELWDVMSGFATAEGFRRGVAFEPRPSDVFVATYPKCGTTLMQQVVHGLRTGGDMDFSDISAVIPWVEMAYDLDQDPTEEQRANPRAFKTHLDWDALPKGGRAIYLIREPEATLVSFYHFFSGWFFEPESIDLETFALEFVLAREGARDYWFHLASWWPHLADPSVLPMCYEDVVEDMAGAVRRVASFIEVDVDESLLSLATEQASIEFMRRFPTLWEDRLIREKRHSVMGLPPEAGTSKVREGKTGRPEREISPRVREVWESRWRETVLPATGCEDYDTLRARIRGLSVE